MANIVGERIRSTHASALRAGDLCLWKTSMRDRIYLIVSIGDPHPGSMTFLINGKLVTDIFTWADGDHLVSRS